MRENTQRLAWTVLTSAFALFCVLGISTVLGGRWFLNNSTRTQDATIILTSGTVLLTRPDAALPEAVLESIDNLPEGVRLETESTSQATVIFETPNGGEPLGTLQLYGNTDTTLVELRSPRFEFGNRPHNINLTLRRGRMRVTVAVGVQQPIVVTLDTPHATVVLERPGSYAVEVSDRDTQVAVRDGAATVSAQGKKLILAADERTYVSEDEPPAGVLRSERNLIQNGDFADSLPQGWTTFQNRQEVEESEGLLEIVVHDGRRAVHFNRRGTHWAEVGIRQEINRDVRDIQSLQLHLGAWLAFQDLQNCGSLGSECPLMVRIEYTDTAGNSYEWLQGFYYLAARGNGAPSRCVTCPPPTGEHAQISNGVWFLYDSPELMELFATTGNPPATVKSIAVYASGHNFESYVSEVELLAED